MKRAISTIMFFLAIMNVSAISLPPYLSDGMVMQQNSVLKISGKAMGNVVIKASWLKSPVTAVSAADSTFCASISTPEHGGPFEISITDRDGNVKTLQDIYSGEVWLCSGQSNMEMPIGKWGYVNNYQQEIADAKNYPLIRLLQISHHIASTPQNEAVVNNGGWQTASPKSVENFSSVAYFFARELNEQLGGAPIGVIDCSWGGTPIEAWTSMESCLKTDGIDCEPVIEDNRNDGKAYKNYLKQLYDWQQLVTSGDNFDISVLHYEWSEMTVPGRWERRQLPDFDGIVWFQREVILPKEMIGKNLKLSLGKIDDEDCTFVNGHKVGETTDCNKLRQYSIDPSLAIDTLVLSVRVTDNGYDGGFWGSPDEMTISDGTRSISIDGKWKYSIVMDFKKTPHPNPPYNSLSPSVLYNAMVYPLKDFKIAGTIWYQGCNNVGRSAQYSTIFPMMISDWRNLFGNQQMPFYYVQLANFLEPQLIQPDSEWAALRQAQASALNLPATGMATAIDIGEAYDIHPKNKQEVARRLSLLALKNTYGQKVTATAPQPIAIKFNVKRVTIHFDGDIIPVAGQPKGFIAMQKDGSWIRPKVSTLSDKCLLLECPSEVIEIRYNWADNPDGNLYGKTGLPVLPFQNKI